MPLGATALHTARATRRVIGHAITWAILALAVATAAAAEGGGAPVVVDRVIGQASVHPGEEITTDQEIELQPGAAVQLRQGEVVAVLAAAVQVSAAVRHHVGDAMRAASRVASWDLASHLGGREDADWQRVLADAPWVKAALAVGDQVGALDISAELSPSDNTSLLHARLLPEAAAFDTVLRLLDKHPPTDRQAALVLGRSPPAARATAAQPIARCGTLRH